MAPPKFLTSKKREGSPSSKTDSKPKAAKLQHFDHVFGFIDPMQTLKDGLYKYKEESDRKMLEIINRKLKEKYGEKAMFRNEGSVLRYVWMIEDGTVASTLDIDKDDLYNPIEAPDKPLQDMQGITMLNSCKNKEKPRMNLEYPCKVCMDQPVSITFIPCGHLAVCGACAPAFGDCPICRQTIKGTISFRF